MWVDLTKPRMGSFRIWDFGKLHHSDSVTRIRHSRISHLRLRCNGKPAAVAEGFWGKLETGCGLLAFVLGAIDHADDALHHFESEAALRSNLFRRVHVLYVVFEHRIENFV